jgi:FKBP-type peptidyl-prolyl cis-trans isomerase
MKIEKLILFNLILATALFSACGGGVKTYKGSDLKNITDSASYLSGVMTGEQMKNDTVYKINMDVYIAALREAYEKDSGFAIATEQRQSVFQRFQQEMDKKLYAKGEAFIENIKKTQNVQSLDGGVLLEVISEGTGDVINLDDSVQFHLTLGTHSNPKIFNTKDDSGMPFPTTKVLDLGQTIMEGTPIAFQKMKVGGTYKVYIPYAVGQPDKRIRGTKPGDASVLTISEIEVK